MREATRKARIGAVATLISGAAVAVAVLQSGSAGHRVFVVADDAVNVIAGQQVRSGGEKIGEVEKLHAIRGGRAARIELQIDDTAWPLPRATKMELRWGGTIAYNDRYIEVRRGTPDNGTIPERGVLAPGHFTVPVEFDELLTTFTPALRRDMKAMLDHGGAAFRESERPLRRSLESAPAAVGEVGAVLADFEARSADLDTLVRSADSVFDAMHRADPGMGRLVSGAAATFRAVASRASALRAALDETPRTLAAARATLARADGTLVAAGRLTDRLGPGVTELRRLSAPLTGLLRSVRQVGPDARATLVVSRRAAPDLDALVARTTELMPRMGSIARQSDEQLACVRPYSPEIAAYFSTWGDFFSNTDGKDRYSRMASQSAPFINAETDDSATVAARNPALTFAFPRPPGLNAGQPWFLPECGAGPEALDPEKDPESRRRRPVPTRGARP